MTVSGPYSLELIVLSVCALLQVTQQCGGFANLKFCFDKKKTRVVSSPAGAKRWPVTCELDEVLRVAFAKSLPSGIARVRIGAKKQGGGRMKEELRRNKDLERLKVLKVNSKALKKDRKRN